MDRNWKGSETEKYVAQWQLIYSYKKLMFTLRQLLRHVSVLFLSYSRPYIMSYFYLFTGLISVPINLKIGGYTSGYSLAMDAKVLNRCTRLWYSLVVYVWERQTNRQRERGGVELGREKERGWDTEVLGIYIYIYSSTIYRHVFRCSTAHQCSLVQSGYGMATIYTQVIVSDNRFWDNSCHAHIRRA